jgi:uncharacterized protein YqgV (UPF0045/DUF77 family)
MTILAQVSLYPLRQAELSPAIESAWQVFEKHRVLYEKGVMSTLLQGELEQLFQALKEALEKAVEFGDVSMVVTISNACPTEPL